MKVSELATIDHLHHAYIVGGGTGAAAEVLAMLEKRGVQVKANADVLVLQYGDLSVDDARSISSYAILKSLGESKYFVISFDKAGDAAQNALLKVVEEAPGNTIFFFCVESEGHLLPTLRSRSVSVTSHGAIDVNVSDDAKKFLKLSYPDRLAKVDKLVSAAQKSQDRAPVRAFVRSLIEEAHASNVSAQKLRTLMNADNYLRLSGSSPKAVLSHLAVVL